ncbi:MAG: hypothetical protein EAZ97_12065 [Bacteroidetes bacterium]|nr:MAG: hypothetical protein EAZ97_12065 [Bacteroidota bacterium]
MERTLKRQQITVGAILKIPLEDNCWTYARILEEKLAFYDSKTDKDLEIEEIIAKPVLFFASVYNSAITKGYWLKIGKKMPLEAHLLDLPPTYSQDILSPSKFEIRHKRASRSVTKEECMGLESSLIWTYNGMENRLNDHYAKRYNKLVDYMLNASIADYINLKPEKHDHRN